MSADILTPSQRSEVMSRIRGRDTRPELRVRSWLHRQGFRFRLHGRDLPGRPDIVLPRFRTVIFVNGCFWHLHDGCPAGRIPRSNSSFWKKKLTDNRSRDERNLRALRAMGWNPIVVWECEVNKDLPAVGARLVDELRKSART